MMDAIKSNKKLKLIIALSGVVIVAWIGYLLYQNMVFRLASTNPSTRNVTFISPFLEAKFNRELDPKGLNIGSTNNIVKSFEVSGKMIIIRLQNMERDKTYTINLFNVAARDGSIIPFKAITFKAKDTNGKLPKDQEEYGLKKQDEEKPEAVVDPILEHLPYSTLTYHISPLVGNNKVILQVNIMPSKADLGPGGQVPDAFVNQNKQAVNDYIRSLKLDPANYEFSYTVITPSIY